MPWRFSRALGGTEISSPLIEHCASIIAIPFQLVDQLGDPGHLGAGNCPDVSLLHGRRLATSSEANERKDCFRPGRMKPKLTVSADRNLHLNVIVIHFFPFPPTLETNQKELFYSLCS